MLRLRTIRARHTSLHLQFIHRILSCLRGPPPIVQTNSVSVPYSTSQSPALVVLPLSRQLKSISLRIQPRGRHLTLDHRDGVKSWVVRLVPGESSIILSNITFLGDNEDDGSSAEEDDSEKDEDYDMDVDAEPGSVSPSKNGRKKGKGRGRGRPPKAATLAAKAAATKATKATKKKPTSKVGEIQLKLNNFVVKEQPDTEGEWNVYLPIGYQYHRGWRNRRDAVEDLHGTVSRVLNDLLFSLVSFEDLFGGY